MTRTTALRTTASGLMLLLLACPAPGCSSRRPATTPVTGRVTLDGKPIAEATVMFEPEAGGVPARASTGDDGSFRLSTFQRNDGALIGRHRVAVSKAVIEGLKADANGLEAAPLSAPPSNRSVVPLRYADPATSGLTADVGTATATIELRLTTTE